MQALAQNVTVIPARRRVGSQRTAAQVQKIRVAAYCRVSTDSEYKMSRPNVQKILYKNVQLVCLF